MYSYDILVQWLITSKSGKTYLRQTKWSRNILASSLSEACAIALAEHQDKITPSISCGWRQWLSN